MNYVQKKLIIGGGAIALIDALGKWYAVRELPHESEIIHHSILTFALHKNPGIAFDIPIPFWIIAPITIAIIFSLCWYAHREWPSMPVRGAASLIIVFGALNNFIDRIINGFTTDYLIILSTSAINLSDILIVVGALMLFRYTTNNPSPRTN